MTDLEKMVWAAAYAAEFARWREFFLEHSRSSEKSIDTISGFSCGEVADVAVEKLREAMTGPDRECLIPVKEQAK